MPTKNILKAYVPNSYYHLYTRGVNKEIIFKEETDMEFFLNLLKRYLSDEHSPRMKHAQYPSYKGILDLLAYCLMRNHLHLLFYQHDNPRAISELMRRVLTTYSMYFNKKYSRVGPLFQSRYLASLVDKDSYLHHISRYIHRNPGFWSEYPYSSLRYYRGEATADWVTPEVILDLFDGSSERYVEFLTDMDEDDEEIMPDYLAHE